MKRTLHTSILILALITSSLSFAGFKSHAELQRFIENYHQNPVPEQIGDLMDYVVQNSLMYETSSRYSIVSFLVGTMERHGETGWPSKWEDRVRRYDEDNYSVLSIPFRFTRTEYLEVLPVSTMYVDSIWGLYFGTGDEEYLTKLMSMASTNPGSDINLAIAVFSARASLAKHAVYMPLVSNFLDTERLYGGSNSRDLASRILNTDPSFFIQEAGVVIAEMMAEEDGGLAKP